MASPPKLQSASLTAARTLDATSNISLGAAALGAACFALFALAI